MCVCVCVRLLLLLTRAALLLVVLLGTKCNMGCFDIVRFVSIDMEVGKSVGRPVFAKGVHVLLLRTSVMC